MLVAKRIKKENRQEEVGCLNWILRENWLHLSKNTKDNEIETFLSRGGLFLFTVQLIKENNRVKME